MNLRDKLLQKQRKYKLFDIGKNYFTHACLVNSNYFNLQFCFFFFSGGVVIYFDRIEVVNILEASSGILLFSR